jgi:hypothetical protein
MNLPTPQRQEITQSIILPGSNFYIFRIYFIEIRLIHGYIFTYYLAGLYVPKPACHFSWHYGMEQINYVFLGVQKYRH